MSSSSPLLSMEGVRKTFGSTLALDGAELRIRPGEVHAVVGENGAGKSTLLGVLDGTLAPEEGTFRFGEALRPFPSVEEALDLGIGRVHQHFTLVPPFTVRENLLLALPGSLPDRRRRMADALGRLQDRTGWALPLEARVATLDVGTRQRVEVLRVLLRDPALLALDEPTAVLAPSEVSALLTLLRELAADGRAVLLVTHKLDEVLRVADRITVLRKGRTVLEEERAGVDARRLRAAILGTGGRGAEERGSGDPAPENPVRAGEGAARRSPAGEGGRGEDAARGDAAGIGPTAPVAELRGVSRRGGSGEVPLLSLSLAVARGEILGIAGVEGNGQRELAMLLSGRSRPDEGIVHLPAEVGLVPQDRRDEGLIPEFDLSENLALALHREPTFRIGPFLRWPAIRAEAERLIGEYGLGAVTPRTVAGTLSGGNQQKWVLARVLRGDPELLVLLNPTRGLDVAATVFLHERLLAGRAGRGTILLSTDLDEILALSDRILVLRGGALLPVPEEERTREGVGGRMVGATVGAENRGGCGSPGPGDPSEGVRG